MKVTRLEIFGFKSFMERLVLPLEHGMSGIVGPNGCGKSNIVDAIRWVLGETRAGALRGDVLEDVIFNGTDKLRPLGLAEVSITVRASQGDFFRELCELAQVAETVPEAAPSTEEGEIAVDEPLAGEMSESVAVLSNEETTPELDEKAESPKLQLVTSSQTAEEEVVKEQPPAIEEVPGFLSRFAWLRSVQEVQVTRRLYRSGESEFFINRVPCRLRDLKEFFRVVGLGPRAYTIVAQGEVGRIVTARPEERRLILEEAAGVAGLRDRVHAARRRLDETSTNISRINDIITEVTRQVQSLRRQASQARNREQLKGRLKELDAALYRARFAELEKKGAQLQETLKRSDETIAATEVEVQSLAASEEGLRAQLMQLDLEGDECRRALDSVREEMNNRVRARSERMARERELRAFVLSSEEDLGRHKERVSTLKVRCEESTVAVTTHQGREKEFVAELAQVKSVGDEALRGAVAELESSRQALRSAERTLQEAREASIRTESALREVRNQIVALSPADQLRRTLSQASQELFSLSSSDANISSGATGRAKLFIDGLSIPKELVRAVQTILGERASFVVAKDPFALARAFLEESSARSSSTDIVGVGVVQAGETPLNAESKFGLSPLVAAIRCHSDVSLALQEFLGHVYVAPTFEDAVSFFTEARRVESVQDVGRYVVVTHEGDLLTAHSFYSLRHEGGAVYLKSKAEDLEQQLAQQIERREAAQSARSLTDARVKAAEECHARELHAFQEREAHSRRVENELVGLRAKMGAEQRLLQQLTTDMQQNEARAIVLHKRLEEYRGELERLEAEAVTLDDGRDAELEALVTEHTQVYEKIEGQRRAHRMTVGESAQRLAMSRNRLDRERQQHGSLMLDVQRQQMELQNVREHVLQEYGAEFLEELAEVSGAVTLNEQELLDARDEVQRIRARIHREGDVDMSSIDRCKEEEERLVTLQAQSEDLTSAARTLEATIQKLIATSKAQFLATFERVQQNFSDLVPRLFGGGRGSLVLLDPENPLESGVDIMVRPPGKKPKTIELLSGGEKAMCATALVMGMFMVKPGPLCIMDEVDAPLDEANLVRFLAIVREMSLRTQFVLITHNKQSMAAADSLVGVTMQEPGASKVIAVSLQEAYSQVA